MHNTRTYIFGVERMLDRRDRACRILYPPPEPRKARANTCCILVGYALVGILDVFAEYRTTSHACTRVFNTKQTT